MKTYNRVLTIAGSDSGGGAGIQADIKTISACGCYAASVITAITVQNTLGVQAVEGISPAIIEGQIRAVLDDIGADAVKIGMLHNEEVVRIVSKTLKDYAVSSIILDPVMVSTSGHRLIEQSAICSLMTDLIPLAQVITPNIPEAEILLGHPITSDNMTSSAQELAQRTGVSVLLKAGHLQSTQIADVLYDYTTGTYTTMPSIRIETTNTHGTGCTLSSALASYLAKGLSLQEAAQAAKQYINSAIRHGAEYKIGHGFGPVAHFYNFGE